MLIISMQINYQVFFSSCVTVALPSLRHHSAQPAKNLFCQANGRTMYLFLIRKRDRESVCACICVCVCICVCACDCECVCVSARKWPWDICRWLLDCNVYWTWQDTKETVAFIFCSVAANEKNCQKKCFFFLISNSDIVGSKLCPSLYFALTQKIIICICKSQSRWFLGQKYLPQVNDFAIFAFLQHPKIERWR